MNSKKYEMWFFLGTCAQANSRRKRRDVGDENLMIYSSPKTSVKALMKV